MSRPFRATGDVILQVGSLSEASGFYEKVMGLSVAPHEKGEQGFRTSAQFGSFFANVKPFFKQIREVNLLRFASGRLLTGEAARRF